MSSNTFYLAGTTGTYWSAPGASSIAISNATGLNFLFEQAGPEQVRLTISGTVTSVAATAGLVNLNAIIPLSKLPKWVYPSISPIAGPSAFTTTVGGGPFQLATIPASTFVNVSRDTTNMVIGIVGYTSTFTSISSNCYNVTYYGTA